MKSAEATTKLPAAPRRAAGDTECAPPDARFAAHSQHPTAVESANGTSHTSQYVMLPVNRASMPVTSKPSDSARPSAMPHRCPSDTPTVNALTPVVARRATAKTSHGKHIRQSLRSTTCTSEPILLAIGWLWGSFIGSGSAEGLLTLHRIGPREQWATLCDLMAPRAQLRTATQRLSHDRPCPDPDPTGNQAIRPHAPITYIGFPTDDVPMPIRAGVTRMPSPRAWLGRGNPVHCCKARLGGPQRRGVVHISAPNEPSRGLGRFLGGTGSHEHADCPSCDASKHRPAVEAAMGRCVAMRSNSLRGERSI